MRKKCENNKIMAVFQENFPILKWIFFTARSYNTKWIVLSKQRTFHTTCYLEIERNAMFCIFFVNFSIRPIILDEIDYYEWNCPLAYFIRSFCISSKQNYKMENIYISSSITTEEKISEIWMNRTSFLWHWIFALSMKSLNCLNFNTQTPFEWDACPLLCGGARIRLGQW